MVVKYKHTNFCLQIVHLQKEKNFYNSMAELARVSTKVWVGVQVQYFVY